MKKILSFLLALTLCLSLCACQKTEHTHDWKPATCTKPKTCSTCNATEGDPKEHDFVGDPKTCIVCGAVQERVIVSVLLYADDEQEDSWLYKQIEEEFYCDIKIIEVDSRTTSYAEKLEELIAAGNPPTIIRTDGYSLDPLLMPAQINEMGEQGKLVDVLAPENLAKMPNFAKLFVEDKDANWEYMLTAAADGSHYLLPTYGYDRAVNHFWVYNETAFKEAGVEWRGDPDGFLDMLRQLKAYYPKSYPMTGGSWSGICDRTVFTWGVNSSYAAYDWDKGEWFYGATSDAYFDMLSMFQMAYNEKLMNPSILFPSSSSTQDDLINHRSFLYNSWLGWMTMHNAAFDYEGVDDHEVPAPAPVGPNGMTLELKKFNNLDGVVISNHDPKAAECALAILDWMYDASKDGGAWLNTVGPEESLTVDENGRYNWIDASSPDGINNDINYIHDKYGMFASSFSIRYCPESPYFTFNAEEQLAQEIGDKIGYFKAPPAVVIKDDLLANIYKESQKKIQDMQVKFIYENWDRAKFDAWVADFNRNYQCVLDYLNS